MTFISANRFRSHTARGQILVKLIKIDQCYPLRRRGGGQEGTQWWLGWKNQEQRQL